MNWLIKHHHKICIAVVLICGTIATAGLMPFILLIGWLSGADEVHSK